jgi:hypothetical protein
MCLYIVIFLDWNIFFAAMSTVHMITIWNLIPTLFLAANMCTSGFLVAHELFHKPNIFDKTIGKDTFYLRNASSDEKSLYALHN